MNVTTRRPRPARLLTLGAAAAAALLLAGCGTTDPAEAEADGAPSTPATEATAGPITVTDGRGEEVTLDEDVLLTDDEGSSTRNATEAGETGTSNGVIRLSSVEKRRRPPEPVRWPSTDWQCWQLRC